ncbi:MAG: sulfite exporter TauE/SafE family protein, partial [Epsilonproteobacteria bacterium]|nr:sulfite exporter TauE/SafE family protein [Campylobacterota bacterium]
MELLGFFLLATLLSTLFAAAGAGSGIALIPLLSFFGVDFNLAKAVGLFSGFATTATSTILNIRRKAVEFRTVLPLALTLPIFSPLGAQLSRLVDPTAVKGLFALFLLFSASMMLFFKKEAKTRYDKPWVMASLGALVGTLAGLLGVGGGNMLLPLLILLGFAPKKVAVAVSFVVPFSALAAFFGYASFVTIDTSLLIACTAGAVTGAAIGNRLLHEKL